MITTIPGSQEHFPSSVLFSPHKRPGRGPAVIIVIAQIGKWDTAQSGISPWVVQTIEELGCEPDSPAWRLCSPSLFFAAKLLLGLLLSIWGPRPPGAPIGELQKDVEGESSECINRYAFPFPRPGECVHTSQKVLRSYKLKNMCPEWTHRATK